MARRTRDTRGRWPGSSCPPPFGLADLRVQPGSGKLQMQRTGMSAYSFRSVWAADERYTTRSVSRRRAAWRRARALNNRAYGLQLLGRHREAEPLLRKALELDPNGAHALYNLGWCLVETGRPREALDSLRRTAALQPTRWEPQLRLAQAYEQL